MRFDLVDLALFIAVADSGSITQGALRAHLALASASAFGKCSDRPEVLASRCTLALTPLAKAARSPRIASTLWMMMRA